MMKKTLRNLLSTAALLSLSYASADVTPYIAIRSQGFNAARELVGWQSLINRYDMDCIYGAFSVTPEYTRTFNSYRLAQALFCDAIPCNACNKTCSTFRVKGSQVLDRERNALMAENFYLPTDFESEVTIQPRIDNFLVDLNFYVGLDEWCNGMYFRVHTPICHTRWNMHFCEDVINKGSANYAPGYFNGTLEGIYPNEYGINRSKMLQSFEEFIIDNMTIAGTPGIMFNSLNKARIAKCELTRTRLAELTAALGWNIINRENGTLGLNIRAAAPTGNSPEGCYLFEPIVGNGHHWELGGGINSYWCMWRSQDECEDFSFYFDANVTHLFKTKQCRTFDLKGKPLSRYMLAMKFKNNVEALQAGADVAQLSTPSAQFAGEYMPVANLTTIPVDVSAAVQADLVFKFAYTHANFQFDIGYDFWARSCLKITPLGSCCGTNFSENTWALKGNAFTYGFTATGQSFELLNTPVALSATQRNATIFEGTNSGIEWNQNTGVDNPQLAWTDGPTELYTKRIGDTTPTQVYTSYQPVFITASDFDIDGARTRGMSHKIFTNFGYIWKDHEEWQPFLGLGAEVEWARHDDRFRCSSCKTTPCESTCNPCHSNKCHTNNNSCCKTVALTQWGVWVKGGVAFD